MLRLDDRRVPSLAVPLGRDVVAARQQQTVQPLEGAIGRRPEIENARLPADVQHRLPVVFELAAG